MKKIIFIILTLLLVGGAIMFLFNKLKNKEIEITDIKSLHLGYSTGTMIYSNVSYDLKLEDDKYIGEIKPNNVSDEEKINVEMKNEDIEKIIKLLKDNHVGRWDGFNKSDQYVLDGNSFSFNVYFTNNTSISASGYMMYPDNYRKVEKELDNIFMSYYKEK